MVKTNDRADINRLIDEICMELGDHISVLSDLASRVTADRAAIVKAWRSKSQRPDPWLEKALDVWLLSLARTSAAVPLLIYVKGIADWAAGTALTSVTYLEVINEFSEMRRALLPFIVSRYQAGPELELVLAGLDSVDRAFRTLVAAEYLDAAGSRKFA
jgi:hypothetical protein